MYNNTYAYIRVSTDEQNEAKQVAKMEKQDILKDNTFIEKVSGKNFQRKEYNKMLKVLNPSDTLFIESIDRLGRNYDEILYQWDKLTKRKKVELRVIETPILNTRENMGLIERYLQNIVLHTLAYQAEQEYINIKKRQSDGIAVAKAEGKKLGRPSKPISNKRRTIISQWQNGHIGLDEAMEILGLKKSSLYNLAKKVEKENNKRNEV